MKILYHLIFTFISLGNLLAWYQSQLPLTKRLYHFARRTRNTHKCIGTYAKFMANAYMSRKYFDTSC